MMTVKKLKNTLEVLGYDDAIKKGLVEITKAWGRARKGIVLVCPKSVLVDIKAALGPEGLPKDKLIHLIPGRSTLGLTNRFRGLTFDETIALTPMKDSGWVPSAIWDAGFATCTNSHSIVYLPKPKVK